MEAKRPNTQAGLPDTGLVQYLNGSAREAAEELVPDSEQGRVYQKLRLWEEAVKSQRWGGGTGRAAGPLRN